MRYLLTLLLLSGCASSKPVGSNMYEAWVYGNHMKPMTQKAKEICGENVKIVEVNSGSWDEGRFDMRALFRCPR